MRQPILALATLLALLIPATAGAGIAPSELCTGNPCIIDSSANLDTGGELVLDFAATDVVLEAALDIGTTSLTIRAGSFTTRRQGQIRGAANVAIETTDFIALDGTRDTGTIRLIGDALALDLRSDGPISAFGAMRLNATEVDSDGGSITVTTLDTVDFRGDIQAVSGNEGEGGGIDITAGGDVILVSDVQISGGDFGGGTILLNTDGSATVGAIDFDGNGELSDGGSIDIVVGDTLIITRPWVGRGSAAGEDCGDGGAIDVVVGNRLDIRAEIDVTSRSGDCCGGAIDLNAATAEIGGVLNAATGPRNGCGGSVDLTTTGNVLCRRVGGATVDAPDFAGDITWISGGDITIANGCDLSAAGARGLIEVRAGGVLTTNANWTAGQGAIQKRGPTLHTAVDAEACHLVIGEDATIAASGPVDTTSLLALGSAEIAGSITAGLENRLTFPPGVLPIISGSVQPPAELVANPKLEPCIVLPTATDTPTATAVPTETPTAPPSPTITTAPSSTPTLPPPTATPNQLPCIVPCPVDCNTDCQVAISELVRSVQISLGSLPVEQCHAADRDGNQAVSISELISGVNNALAGCPLEL